MALGNDGPVYDTEATAENHLASLKRRGMFEPAESGTGKWIVLPQDRNICRNCDARLGFVSLPLTPISAQLLGCCTGNIGDSRGGFCNAQPVDMACINQKK